MRKPKGERDQVELTVWIDPATAILLEELRRLRWLRLGRQSTASGVVGELIREAALADPTPRPTKARS